MTYKRDYGGWLFWAIFIILIMLILALGAAQTKDCNDRGGEMVEVGTYTTYSVINNIVIPHENPEYACVVNGTK